MYKSLQILIAGTLTIFFVACQNNKETVLQTIKPLNDDSVLIDSAHYSISITQLDSSSYFSLRGANIIGSDNKKVITDIKQIESLLQDVVDFEVVDGEYLIVRSIYFRNAGVYNALYEPPYVVAYYPDEDALVCEGGHSMDLIFNLSTGIEQIGNPSFTFSNTSKTLRFGSLYNGQASEFMIEKKYDNHFQKFIKIDEIISLNTGYVFEMVEEVKWLDDSTFIFKALDAYHLKTEESKTIYYKIILLKFDKNFHHKTAFKHLDPTSFVSENDKIVQTINADLNGDKKPDIIFLTQQNYEWLYRKDEDGNNVNLNRRGIIVALNHGNTYELIVNNPSCFYSDNEYGGNYFAPELDLQVENQQLFIHFSHGRYGYWHYKLALQKKKMIMVEYFNNYSRGPVIQEETIINFLSKTKIIDDNINKDTENDEDIKLVRSTSKININKLINLSQIEMFEELDMNKLLELTK